MLITRLRLKNWRNFAAIDVPLRETTYIIGANAAGKSNLLDALRFLHDISKAKGGGLQAAVAERGGISSLRCLHARRDPEVIVDVDLADSADEPATWRYTLGFKSEGKGTQRTFVSREEVWKEGVQLLGRPTKTDNSSSLPRSASFLRALPPTRRTLRRFCRPQSRAVAWVSQPCWWAPSWRDNNPMSTHTTHGGVNDLHGPC